MNVVKIIKTARFLWVRFLAENLQLYKSASISFDQSNAIMG